MTSARLAWTAKSRDGWCANSRKEDHHRGRFLRFTARCKIKNNKQPNNNSKQVSTWVGGKRMSIFQCSPKLLTPLRERSIEHGAGFLDSRLSRKRRRPILLVLSISWSPIIYSFDYSRNRARNYMRVLSETPSIVLANTLINRV